MNRGVFGHLLLIPMSIKATLKAFSLAIKICETNEKSPPLCMDLPFPLSCRRISPLTVSIVFRLTIFYQSFHYCNNYRQVAAGEIVLEKLIETLMVMHSNALVTSEDF